MAKWYEAKGVHTLEMGKRIVATIKPGGDKRHEDAAVYEIDVDPAEGIQRPNERMKLTGIALGGVLRAKQTINGRLARFGFQRLLASDLETQLRPAARRKARVEKAKKIAAPKPKPKK